MCEYYSRNGSLYQLVLKLFRKSDLTSLFGMIKEHECAGVPLEWNALVEWTRHIGNPETELDRLMNSGVEHLCQHYGVPEILREKKKLSARKEISAGSVGSSSQSNHAVEDEKSFRNLTAVIDSLGQCLFPASALGIQEYTNLLNATTGSDRTVEQVLEIGNRICNTEIVFNKIAGIKPKDE